MLNVILFLTVLFTILILNIGYYFATKERRNVKNRLVEAAAPKKTFEESPAFDSVKSLNLKNSRLMDLGSILFSKIMGRKLVEKLKKKLSNAGIALRPEEFMLLLTIITLICFLAASFILKNKYLSLVIGLVTFISPFLLINSLRKKRLLKLEMQLLDALLLLANGLRSGLSLMQAWSVTAKELNSPLAEEFHRVLRENSLGISLDTALMNMVERVDSKDVELVISGILIQREVGGNLAEVLDSIADTIDKRVKLRGKIRVLTAQGRLSGLIVSILPFALGAFIFIFHPEFGSILLTDSIGRMMLIGALVLLIIGVILIRKVVTIDD